MFYELVPVLLRGKWKGVGISLDEAIIAYHHDIAISLWKDMNIGHLPLKRIEEPQHDNIYIYIQEMRFGASMLINTTRRDPVRKVRPQISEGKTSRLAKITKFQYQHHPKG